MEGIREVKKSFCVVSAAYIIIGLVLLIWPDLSVKTFCYVFGIGMIIFGCAHLILYFTKDKMQSLMQMDMVAGIVGLSTGAYILIKMEYMIEIIPFALGIVALLGAVIKLQNTMDIRRLGCDKWYIMLAMATVLAILGILLIVNPFEDIAVIEKLVGVSLMIDGIGNLAGIFWIGYLVKHPEKAFSKKAAYSVEVISGADETDEKEVQAEPDESEISEEDDGNPAGLTAVSKVSMFRPVVRDKKREKKSSKEKPAEEEE